MPPSRPPPETQLRGDIFAGETKKTPPPLSCKQELELLVRRLWTQKRMRIDVLRGRACYDFMAAADMALGG